MLPYVLRSKRISYRSLIALKNAQDLFDNIPERADGEWTCHSMVEALHTLLERDPQTQGFWKPVHGFFTKGYRHSWLINEQDQDLLDPYPVACASGPLLISIDPKSPWVPLFIADGVYYEGKLPMIQSEAEQIVGHYDHPEDDNVPTRVPQPRWFTWVILICAVIGAVILPVLSCFTQVPKFQTERTAKLIFRYDGLENNPQLGVWMWGVYSPLGELTEVRAEMPTEADIRVIEPGFKPMYINHPVRDQRRR